MSHWFFITSTVKQLTLKLIFLITSKWVDGSNAVTTRFASRDHILDSLSLSRLLRSQEPLRSRVLMRSHLSRSSRSLRKPHCQYPERDISLLSLSRSASLLPKSSAVAVVGRGCRDGRYRSGQHSGPQGLGLPAGGMRACNWSSCSRCSQTRWWQQCQHSVC
jgi:hypothetical protein